MSMSELAFEEINDWLVVRFTSPSLTEPMLLERLTQEIEGRLRTLPPKSKVLMSFKGVDFVSSQIIGVMLSAKDHVVKNGGSFALARLGTNIADILKITRLDKQFKIDIGGMLMDAIQRRLDARTQPQPEIQGRRTGAE